MDILQPARKSFPAANFEVFPAPAFPVSIANRKQKSHEGHPHIEIAGRTAARSFPDSFSPGEVRSKAGAHFLFPEQDLNP